jgi:site-specific DNA recombinase
MKKVVIYTRVSTDEQKENGFSLQDQEQRLIKHCQFKNYQILKHYQDDHSAKTFKRPAFNQFLKDVESKTITPDIFVCIRMDRFSRNSMESLLMLRRFGTMGIGFETVEGNVDQSDPESMLPFYISVVLPEVENKRRALNTKRGMRQASKEGRWTHKAPMGYKNDPISGIIFPDANLAPHITWSFTKYAEGLYSAAEVLKMLRDKGVTMSKQNFLNILSNPVYAGRIVIKEWQNEPETIVRGLHKPLIDEETFRLCQQILKGKRKPYQSKTQASELPLRGHLLCPVCNRVLTGSGSKGNGGIFHYYHCQANTGCKTRFQANKANSAFEELLKTFQFDKETVRQYRNILDEVFRKNDNERSAEKAKLQRDIENVERRLQSLKTKFIDDLISPTDYKNWKQDLDSDLENLVAHKQAFEKNFDEYKLYINSVCTLLGNVQNFYQNATPTVKSKLIGSIFPEKLTFSERGYRTTKVNEVFSLLSNLSKGFKKEKPIKIDGLSSVAPKAGLEPATL